MLVVNLPGKGTFEFRLRLPAEPRRTEQFGPWHLADRIASPLARSARRRTPTPSTIACFKLCFIAGFARASSFRRLREQYFAHVSISPHPDFRHASWPALSRPDRKLPCGQRAHGADRPDLVINTGESPSTGRPAATMCSSQRTCTTRCPSTVAIFRAITTSATIRLRLGPAPKPPIAEAHRQQFRNIIGEDHWSFEAAGWRFIGLNSLVMNSGLAFEAEQFDWLASEIAGQRQAGRAVPAQAGVSPPARRS